jgi:nucleotide-binding universal stress UspA family protein
MYERILVPTDGSTGTAHVALQALDLAEQYDATVHTIHVIDENASAFLSESGGDTDPLSERAEDAVRTVEQMAESHGIDVVTVVREGKPAETILQYADEIDADVIVAGTHGRSGIKRHLIGSVAERLVRHATCPVLTIRLPDTDVTVDTVDQARALMGEALSNAGYDLEPDEIERQLSVWVGTADHESGHLVVYLDPETQRTSVLSQRGSAALGDH